MTTNKDNLIFEKTSFLHGVNSPFIKELYLKYLNNPKSIPQSWTEFFDGLNDDQEIIKKEILGPSWAPRKKSNLGINYNQKNFSKLIAEKSNTQVINIYNKNELESYLKRNLFNDEMVICMGAGSISNWIREIGNRLK